MRRSTNREVDALRKALDAAITALAIARAEGAAAERERVAARLCNLCRRGIRRDGARHIVTYSAGNGSDMYACDAAAILDERGTS